MSLQTIVYDCPCARVDTLLGEPIPLESIQWEAGYLVLRALHGDGLVERFATGPGSFVVTLSHPELGEQRYLVDYRGAIVFPCELPGGEAAVREVVALSSVKWKAERPAAKLTGES